MPVNHRSVALLCRRCVSLLLLLLLAATPASLWRPRTGWWGALAVGVNWGASSSSHPLPPSVVVPWILKANGVSRVKLPDADPSALASLAGSDIGVAIGIPNEMLRSLSSSKSAAAGWVHDNVTRYMTGNSGSVRIEFVVVGDDPFLTYGQTFRPFVVGAATNVQRALAAVNLANKMKVIVPCSSDVYQTQSNLPSKGHFRPELNKTMAELLSFLNKFGSPFVIDINPFLSLQQNKNVSLDFFLFRKNSHLLSDGPHEYKNYFDMSIDTLISALSKVGYDEIDIVVGKIGWPTNGAINATPAIAESFMQGLIGHLQSKVGTPLRPKRPPKEAYIFSLLDEYQRSIKAGGYESHWGIYTFDGQAKYNLDLGQGSKALGNAHDVDYLAQKWCVVNNNKDMSNVSSSASEACSSSDCSALSPGGSCSEIGWPGNVSYAFNSFFQLHDQSADSCYFGGMGLITTVDPSVGDCQFTIAFRTSFSTTIHPRPVTWWKMVRGWNPVLLFLLFVWY